ncbi:cysteine-rich 2-like isoform X1 [Labeo rohita]|uniref:Cysteine-rich 2-like isoform X1 n=1 Tax=Labeo rohita TaxID=84645 RepID=A0A498NF71_LABRO|nr:cysteine-rich 2-like isoform X1 [Labeo rohita]
MALLIAEKVSSLGKNWHRFCLKCERCSKILSPGGHAELLLHLHACLLERLICVPAVEKQFISHEGNPYCHVPCYGYLFGPKGVNIGKVGCYIYEKENAENEMPSEH